MATSSAAAAAAAAFPLILTIIIFLHPSSTFSLSINTAAIISKQSSSSSSSQNKIKICCLTNYRPSSCSSQLNHFSPFSTIYDDDHDQKIADSSSSSSFFKQSSLVPGTKIPHQEPHQHHYYFPKRAQEVILVSQSFPPNSTKESIKSTLIHYCNSLAIKNSEFTNCLKSLNEMTEFSRTALGDGSKKLVGLTSKGIKVINQEVELVIGDVRKIGRSKIVSCHGVLLDTPAYFCHLVSSTEVYVVDVIDRVTGSPVNRVLAACHMDTSSWSKDHVAFKILKSSPGMTEVCHWNADLDLVWI